MGDAGFSEQSVVAMDDVAKDTEMYKILGIAKRPSDNPEIDTLLADFTNSPQHQAITEAILDASAHTMAQFKSDNKIHTDVSKRELAGRSAKLLLLISTGKVQVTRPTDSELISFLTQTANTLLAKPETKDDKPNGDLQNWNQTLQAALTNIKIPFSDEFRPAGVPPTQPPDNKITYIDTSFKIKP